MTNEQIAAATKCPLVNVNLYWPVVKQYMYQLNIGSRLSQIGALATIAIETAYRFKAIKEFGKNEDHEKEYGGRHDLGNINPGDGAKYAGRGLIQITGRANYAAYGHALGIDLVNFPDRALDNSISSNIFAHYWRDRGISGACEALNWPLVRKKVNGGLNEFPDFYSVVQRLLAIQ